jgi:curved DNA-binding protein
MKFKGEDYSTELHLDLLQAFKTHPQIIVLNGKNIRITIPAGIEHDQLIKLKGHGGIGLNGGPNGDLYITFKIAPNERFVRIENNLYTTVTLDLYTAILGGEITLNLLIGKAKLKVKPGTQNGSKTKLKGKGFPIYKHDGQFGDLVVTYNILIPTDLNQQQKDLFTQLSELKPNEVH